MRVEDILKKSGPMLSGQLAKLYEKENNTSNVVARKALSRARSPVQKLCNISFDNNQKFFYLESQYMGLDYRNNLIEAIKSNSKAYYSVILALINNHGYASTLYLPSLTFSPVENLKGHRIFNRIIEDLIDLRIITKVDDYTLMLSEEFGDSNYSKYKAVESAMKVIVNDFNEWAKKINFIAFNSGKTLLESPIFSKFQWCFSAPSYLVGLKNEGKPGMVVVDVLMGDNVTYDRIEFLISKINIIKQLRNHLTFIPAILTDSLEENAFRTLKENGILILTLNNLFSLEYVKALKNLMTIICNASAIISKHPEEFFKYIDSISKLEGKAGNMRGELFELAVGYHYSLNSKYIEINKIIRNPNSGKRNEIDVFVDMNYEIRFVECKGYKYKLDVEYVKNWLSETIINIREWILEKEDKERKLVFELWSTGGFEDEALNILKKQSEKTKKYEIRYYGRDEIIEIANSMDNKNLKNLIYSYF